MSGGYAHKETSFVKFHIVGGKVPTIDASLTALWSSTPYDQILSLKMEIGTKLHYGALQYGATLQTVQCKSWKTI